MAGGAKACYIIALWHHTKCVHLHSIPETIRVCAVAALFFIKL